MQSTHYLWLLPIPQELILTTAINKIECFLILMYICLSTTIIYLNNEVFGFKFNKSD